MLHLMKKMQTWSLQLESLHLEAHFCIINKNEELDICEAELEAFEGESDGRPFSCDSELLVLSRPFVEYARKPERSNQIDFQNNFICVSCYLEIKKESHLESYSDKCRCCKINHHHNRLKFHLLPDILWGISKPLQHFIIVR